MLFESRRRPMAARHRNHNDRLVCALLVALGLYIGLFNFSNSGSLWPDSPQYTNAGAMIHDWLLSGEILHPYRFAEANYAQYPAFHIPYHPPIYPGLLGLLFVATGVSYIWARLFVALCLGVTGYAFYAILRRLEVARSVSLACAVLLITTPEIAFWSRDTMSEIPSLALIVSGSYFFLVWLQTNRPRYYIGSFILAEFAFLSRVLTAGILPAWFVWALLAKQGHRFKSLRVLAPPMVYLTINLVWVLFTLRFSKYETGFGDASVPNRNYAGMFSWSVFSYYGRHLPEMVGWIGLVAGVAGIACVLWYETQFLKKHFWLIWFLSYALFFLVVGKLDEPRYFLYALVAFPGWVASIFKFDKRWRLMGWILFAAGVTGNLHQISNFPRGVVGSRPIGELLAGMNKPGNILMSCEQQSDFILHYRASHPRLQRTIIRADRSLAIRPPEYTGTKTIFIAQNSEDAIDVIRRGRVRYIVGCTSVNEYVQNAPEETVLLQATAQAHRELFSLIGTFPLLVEYSKPGREYRVSVWEFTGELPTGPSEIPVVVPTADLVIQPQQ